MTDIEKKKVTITLGLIARTGAVVCSVIASTWYLGGRFSEAKAEFYGLKEKIIVMAKNDSLKTLEIAAVKQEGRNQRHELDSVKRIVRLLTVKAHLNAGIAYVRERKVNGHIVTEIISD